LEPPDSAVPGTLSYLFLLEHLRWSPWSAAAISADEWLTATGNWVNDRTTVSSSEPGFSNLCAHAFFSVPRTRAVPRGACVREVGPDSLARVASLQQFENF
jgi:hypothetical protein